MGWWSDLRGGGRSGASQDDAARQARRLADAEALEKEERCKMDDSFADSCLDQAWDEAAAKLAAGASGRGGASRHSALFWIASGNGPLELAMAVIPTLDAEFKERQGQSPLMAAASNGNLAMAEILLPLGGIGDKDDRDCDPLLHAAANGRAKMVGLLLAAGAVVTEKSLQIAVYSGSLETAEALLAGAPSSLMATSPLASAAVMGMTCEIKPIRKANSPRDIMKFGFDSCPALADAGVAWIGKRGSLEMLRLAMSFDQGPLASSDGATALMVAAKAGEARAVRELVGLGGVHAQGRSGDFALGLAAVKGSEACVKILLAASAATPLAEKQMASAAMDAAREGNLSCARIIWDKLSSSSRQGARKDILDSAARSRHATEDKDAQDGLALAMMAAAGASPIEISQALVAAVKAGNVKLADALFPLSDTGSNALAAFEDLARSSKASQQMSALVSLRAHSMMEEEELARASQFKTKSSEEPARTSRL